MEFDAGKVMETDQRSRRLIDALALAETADVSGPTAAAIATCAGCRVEHVHRCISVLKVRPLMTYCGIAFYAPESVGLILKAICSGSSQVRP